jgi:malate dehydrogenase
MSRPKVGIIGAGNVGATAAQQILARCAADCVLIDVIEGLPQGKALDLSEAAPAEERVPGAVGGGYELMDGAAVVVITAGVARKPGMSRDDLLATNAGIVKSVADEVRVRAPSSFVLVVTNPLDVMTWLVWKTTGFPRSRVLGMAGVLDASRLAFFVSAELGVSPKDVHAMVLGGHADTMVPLPRFTTVSGVPITELLPPDAIARLIRRTRDGGAEIVSLLKQGSAFYAPGASVALMVGAFLGDEHRLVPASAVLDGEYGERGVCLGVPVVLGGGGAERIIELNLSDVEKAGFLASAEAVRAGIRILQEKRFI